MIINIWKKQELDLLKELPTEVLSAIETIIELLDENYGTGRISEYLGWYVVVVNKDVIRYLVKEGPSEEDEDHSFFDVSMLNCTCLKFVI